MSGQNFEAISPSGIPEISTQPLASQIINAYYGGEIGNDRGLAVEQRVARVLAGMCPIVDYVELSVKNGEDDANKIDGIVFLAPSMDRLINHVYIQIKSSSFGMRSFRNNVSRLVRSENELGVQTVDDWTTNKRLILLNGGETTTRRTGERQIVTDEQIAVSFMEQLGVIEGIQPMQGIDLAA